MIRYIWAPPGGRLPAERPGRRCPMRKAFTLIELLVVIGIIAVLTSVLLPALSRAREEARIVACASNERQIYQALAMYACDNKGTMPIPGVYGDVYPNLMIVESDWGEYSYTDGILWPYIPGGPTRRQQLFLCPDDGPDRPVFSGQGYSVADLAKQRNFTYNFNREMIGRAGPPVMTSKGLINFGYTGVRLSQIKGSDHKLLVLECDGPHDAYEFLQGSDPNRPFFPLSQRHFGRGNECMADGHVELMERTNNLKLVEHYTVLLPNGQGGYVP